MRHRLALPSVLVCAFTACSDPLSSSAGSSPNAASARDLTPSAQVIVTGLAGATGSAIGPGGDLYVAEAVAGEITRIDLKTGAVSTFASGLPARVIPVGGVMDVAFVGRTAYALVTLVGPDVGGSAAVGLYRVDGPTSFTLIADIGAFSIAHPPATAFDVPSGVQYALEPFRGGFLVTDGHLNRVLYVSRDGEISVAQALGNVVPTGLAVHGQTVYLALAGPVPHPPALGKVVTFDLKSAGVTQVAAGAPLAVDVEFGRGQSLFVLAQGVFPAGGQPGAPAMANTGTLFRVGGGGTLTPVVTGLDRPTSVEIDGTTAYVVTLAGEVVRIDDIDAPPFGKGRP
jgi:hypothetical protein